MKQILALLVVFPLGAQACPIKIGDVITYDDPRELLARVPEFDAKKDQFETTSEHRTRWRIQNQTLNEVRFQVLTKNLHFSQYDADKKSWNTAILTSATPWWPDRFPTSLVVSSKIEAHPDYLASNALGAVRRVEHSTFYQTEIVSPASINEIFETFLNITTPMSPEEARSVGELRVGVVGRLQAPGILENYERQAPKLDKPRDYEVYTKGLTAEIECLVITDTQNRVLKTVLADPMAGQRIPYP